MLNSLLQYSQIKLSKEYSFYYKTWLSSFIAIVIANAVVHNLLIDRFYEMDLTKILRTIKDPRIPGLELNVLSYAIITAVMVFFISRTLPKKHTVPVGVLYGMLFGVTIFWPHTLANFVTIKYWSVAIVIIESCWGVLQGGLIGFVTAYIYKDHLKKGLLDQLMKK